MPAPASGRPATGSEPGILCRSGTMGFLDTILSNTLGAGKNIASNTVGAGKTIVGNTVAAGKKVASNTLDAGDNLLLALLKKFELPLGIAGAVLVLILVIYMLLR